MLLFISIKQATLGVLGVIFKFFCGIYALSKFIDFLPFEQNKSNRINENLYGVQPYRLNNIH